MSQNSLYHYRALVTEVYDGDTITCDIDLGLNLWLKDQKLRLYGINTPEVRGEKRQEGLVVRDWLRSKILGQEVIIETFKDRTGKYGRWLAMVWLKNECLNETLVAKKMARRYMLE